MKRTFPAANHPLIASFVVAALVAPTSSVVSASYAVIEDDQAPPVIAKEGLGSRAAVQTFALALPHARQRQGIEFEIQNGIQKPQTVQLPPKPDARRLQIEEAPIAEPQDRSSGNLLPVANPPAIATQTLQQVHVVAKMQTSAAPVATAPIVASPEVWTIKPASYLRDTLSEWSIRAGWSLVWGLDEYEDLRMDAANDFHGDFKTVVSQLFNSFPQKVRIHAELRPDNSPPLLFVNREDGLR